MEHPSQGTSTSIQAPAPLFAHPDSLRESRLPPQPPRPTAEQAVFVLQQSTTKIDRKQLSCIAQAWGTLPTAGFRQRPMREFLTHGGFQWKL